MKFSNAIKKIFIYLLVVIGIGLLFFGINWITEYVRNEYTSVPYWIVPIIFSILTVSITTIIWKRTRELDLLKYEFITIVTHKFRTPLTRIKWSLELLKGKQSDEHAELAVTDIKLAEEALVELTDTLVDLTRTAQSGYVYAFERVDITEKVRNTINTLATRFADKHIKVNISCPFDKVMVLADNRRILFALNILIENALAYTSDGGQISVSVGKGTHTGFIAIKDNGIGISKEDISKVLTRFWRSGNAKKMDTEGMGIGLYMANQILLRHKGSLSIVSEGEGKGSTFTMNIPLA